MTVVDRYSPPSPGLASRSARHFSAGAIYRAQAHAHEKRGKVQLDQVATRSVQARVEAAAGTPHTVNVAAPIHRPGVLRCGCTCAAGSGGEPCEHVYAVLLILDRQAIDLGAVGKAFTLEVGPPWLGVFGSDAEGTVEASPVTADARDVVTAVAAPARSRVSVARPGKAARAPGWAERLGWLEDDEVAPASRAETSLVIEYVLTGEAPCDAHGRPRAVPAQLEILTYVRPPRRDGAPGAREVLPLHDGRPAGTVDAVDDRALAALGVATPIESGVAAGAWDGQAWVQRREGRGARVHAAIVDRVLPALCATGRAGWLDPHAAPPGATAVPLQALRWDGDAPFHLAIDVRATAGGARLEAALVRGAERLPLAALTVLFGAGCAAVGDRLIRVVDGADLARWWVAAATRPVDVPRHQLGRFVAQLAEAVRGPALSLDPATGWRVVDVAPTPHLELEELGGWYGGKVVYRYGDVRRTPDLTGGFVVDAVAQALYRVDLEREAELRAAVRERCGVSTGRRIPTADVEVAAERMLELLPVLDADGWQVWLRKVRVRSGGRMTTSVATGIDWFDLTLGAEIGGAAVDGRALIDALRAGNRLVRLVDGSQGVVPAEWLERHRELVLLGRAEGGALRVPRTRALMLDVLLETLPAVTTDARFRKLRDRLGGFAGVAARGEPARFAGTLRPYQREGLGWLGFLRDVGFGGCLADDMGLGKTVQVLAALAEHRRGRRNGRPWLVVAPRSVVFNWIDEARRFVPGIRIVDYTGKERARSRPEIAAADLVVTTYATLRLDAEVLAAIPFDTVILDEAQNIKNPDAQISKAARLLQAEHRLALSGTPVENHLGDLGSIFEFLNPGMIGDVGALGALGGRGGTEPDGLAPLAQALRPFLLRRTKAQVLPDLPARTEQVLRCRLEGAQRRFYDQLREGYRGSLLAQVERDGMARSTMHVLEALLRLRQAACFPGLVQAERAGDGSAKLDLLMEQLAEVCASGQKAIVFSQFTQLLAQVRLRLTAAGIDHEYLDGQTRDRKARVARFQDTPACQVFAVSLKAGGTGLNLTAASYVYLLDPWWNPAVEAQAIDRAHRIGQTQPVFAYRLIAEDTVEDKILQLQHHKRELLDGLFAEDAGQLASLTASDLASLLAP